MRLQRIGVLSAVVGVLVAGCGSDAGAGAATTTSAPMADAGASARAAGSATPGARAAHAAAATGTNGQLLSAADRASFLKLGATLAGQEGVAVTTLGTGATVYRAGTLTTGAAWSTSKPAVAMAAIVAGTASSTDLSEAITASDNDAAQRLWAGIGTAAAAATASTAQVRAAGDQQTVIESQRLRGAAYTAFGQTNWSLTNEARFAAGMGCTVAGRRVLGLMRHVIPSQRWGLGTIGAAPALKGGWGPGVRPGIANGWMERQLGIVSIRGRAVAVAIASTAHDHATGTANLTKIASWLKTHVDPRGAPNTPACA